MAVSAIWTFLTSAGFAEAGLVDMMEGVGSTMDGGSLEETKEEEEEERGS